MNNLNPYRPPIAEPSAPANETLSEESTFFSVSWLFVFSANLIVPLLLSWGLTQESGRIGMTVAIMIFLVGGWYVGRRFPKAGKRLIAAGGTLAAISQLFPLHDFIAGTVAYEVARLMGGAIQQNDDNPIGEITTEYGGFVCTFVTGTMLLTIAVAIGWLVVALRPRVGENPK